MNTFYILDFDRCLGNTDAIQTLLEKVITSKLHISTESFAAARVQMESEAKTFTTIQHIHLLLKQSGDRITWEDLREALIEAAHDVDLLSPFARDLLAKLDENDLPYGIITYGAEEAWQLTKLEIAGLLGVPHLVTKIETKGELLMGWQQPDGTFSIPPALSKDFVPQIVNEIILVDDKAKSFWNIPDGVHGVHVIAPSGNTLPAQQGSVPASVTDVTGLDGVIKLLFS